MSFSKGSENINAKVSKTYLRRVSNLFKSFRFVVPLLLFIITAEGQDIDVVITVSVARPEVITVRGRMLKGTTGPNLSFLTKMAGMDISGTRISELKLYDINQGEVSYKRLIPGEYLAASDFSGFEYQVVAGMPKNPALMPRVSWVTKDEGIMMLADLLPQFGKSQGVKSARVRFEWPEDVPIFTSEPAAKTNTFSVKNIDDAVFYFGKNWESVTASGGSLKVLVCGARHFAPVEAETMVVEIYREYRRTFGFDSLEDLTVAIGRFPANMNPGVWEAETRGTSITIISADMPFKTQSLQRLHEQLRHEIFHLWIPNAVDLKGNYDWFYEGFALYQSLKTAVLLNRIRFEDFLDTLSRAHNIDSVMPNRISLIEASKNRWGGNNTQLYARGMLVAFLSDLAILQKSRGRRSVENILREIFEKHRFDYALTNVRASATGEDANAAILKILSSYPELQPIIVNYINGNKTLEWASSLASTGLESIGSTPAAVLRVRSKLNGRQKDLLNKLGYNSWKTVTSDE